jgi:hypothetical protein
VSNTFSLTAHSLVIFFQVYLKLGYDDQNQIFLTDPNNGNEVASRCNFKLDGTYKAETLAAWKPPSTMLQDTIFYIDIQDKKNWKVGPYKVKSAVTCIKTPDPLDFNSVYQKCLPCEVGCKTCAPDTATCTAANTWSG